MDGPGITSVERGLAWLDQHLNREASAGRIEGLSLDPIRALMNLLGDPQDTFASIHVTGTDGKGSVVAFCEQLLIELGLNTGATTSPHLERLNERMRRNGVEISDSELTDELARVALHTATTEQRWSWFELVVATAFGWFAAEAVDVAVVEVGLLGRFDATNVVEAEVAVCTNIGQDHVAPDPGWADRIAQEKAGIVTAGRPLILGNIDAALLTHFEVEQASSIVGLGHGIEIGAHRQAVGGSVMDLTTPWGEHDELFVPSFGRHQAENAAVAVTAVEAFIDRALPDDLLAPALAAADLPGRLEVLATEPLVVLDGAHTPQAMSAVLETVEVNWPHVGARLVVFGHLAPRDPSVVLEVLAKWSPDLVITCCAEGDRSIPAEELSRAAQALDLPAEVGGSVHDALARGVSIAESLDLVLVVGSTRVVAEARSALRSVALEALGPAAE